MYFDLNGCLECFVCINKEEVLSIQRRAAVIKQLEDLSGETSAKDINSLTKPKLIVRNKTTRACRFA